MVCPPADMLAAFAAGELSVAEVTALEPHLDACASCLGVVAGLGRSAGAEVELAPGAQVARYQILSLVGRGAFGAVYAAYDPELDRKIALKLVPRRDAVDEERFLREARAMARLSSPHVVAVHDVGRIDAGLFIAMEFVDGETLDAWLAAGPRSARDIAAVFVQAGRGLAAAHAAGIVHRDFKPENVLVHRSGRVAVTDFGLAGATVGEGGAVGAEPLAALTVEGALVGTPLYMAPEALRRSPVDARSDLFSFCVALYAALFGAHPFPAATVAELEAAFARAPRPPRDAKVPRHVRDAVLAGLQIDPALRPQSMAALVRRLEHDPRRTRLAVAAAGTVVVGAAIAWLVPGASSASRGDECRARADALVDATWGPERRAAVRAGIARSKSPLAADAIDRVGAALDRYADAWEAGWVDACQASDPRDQLELRMACLERRRAQWGALVSTLEHADATAVLSASSAGYALPGVELCADPRWLASRGATPEEDARLAASYAAIARAQVLSDLGSTDAGLAALAGPLAQAHASGDRALEAEARLVEGDLRRAVEPRAAEAPLHAAAIAASAVGRLDLEAAAKVLLVETLAHTQLRLAESALAADYAEAAVSRLGDPSLIADYCYARGLVEWSSGGAERSLPIERVNLLTQLAVRGIEHPKVAEALNSIAVSFEETEQLAASLPLQRAALAMRERLQGASHPEALNARGNLALALAENGDIAEAVRLQESVLADRKRILGPDYIYLGETYVRLARLYQRELGRWPDALAAARAANDLDAHTFGDDAAEGIASRSTLARVLAAQGAAADAELWSTRALATAEANLPPDHPLTRAALATRADTLARAGRCTDVPPLVARLDQASAGKLTGRADLVFGLRALARCQLSSDRADAAIATLERALAVREASRGAHNPMIADVLIDLAEAHRVAAESRASHLAAAEAAAARAVAVREGVPGYVLAAARFELARVRAAADPAGARALAEQAQAWLRAYPELPLAREVERWLATSSCSADRRTCPASPAPRAP